MAKKIFYGWWVVLACGFIGFFKGGVVSFGFTAFFEPFVKEFGWSYAQVSFAKSLRGLEMSVFAPIIGFLVDRFGSKRLISLGIVTIGSGLILLSITQSLPMFYASFLIIAFGSGGLAGVVLMSAVANWFDKKVGRALGIVACGTAAGGFIIPLIVWLIDIFHWRTALVILGFGIWILGIPLSLSIRDKPEKSGSISDGKSLHNPMLHLKNKGKGGDITFREVLKQKAFLYLNIVELLRQMVTSAVMLHVMPYLSTVSISRSTAGMAAAALPLFSIAGRFGFGWFADVFDKKHTVVIALALMGTGLLGFSYVQQVWAIFIFILVFSLGWGGSMITIRTILLEYFGKSHFAKMLGIMMGAGSIGGIIGPTLAGGAFDILGSYHLIWLVFSSLSGLSIGLILRVKPLTRGVPPEASVSG